MASVAKWLRQRIVVPPLAGSTPVVRPLHNFTINCVAGFSPTSGGTKSSALTHISHKTTIALPFGGNLFSDRH